MRSKVLLDDDVGCSRYHFETRGLLPWAMNGWLTTRCASSGLCNSILVWCFLLFFTCPFRQFSQLQLIYGLVLIKLSQVNWVISLLFPIPYWHDPILDFWLYRLSSFSFDRLGVSLLLFHQLDNPPQVKFGHVFGQESIIASCLFVVSHSEFFHVNLLKLLLLIEVSNQS